MLRVCTRSRTFLSYSPNIRWFSPDAITAMLVHRTKEKKVLREFHSIIMQNIIHNLLLFCAPTWPSYHVTENLVTEENGFARALGIFIHLSSMLCKSTS